MLETIWKRQTRPWVFVGLLVIVGAIVRVIVNDVAAYSPADEAHYVDVTRRLTREGLGAYPEFVSTYLTHPSLWLSPTPLRWGYFGLTTLTCSVLTPCDGRAIAWLSTIAGVLSLVLTYALGRRLVGRNAALFATALSVLSPLQLALGRRALQDEVYCAAVLAAFWTLMRLFDPEVKTSKATARRRWAGFVATSTLAFAIKEAFVFPYAAFVLLYFLARPDEPSKLRHAALFVLPPLLFCAGFVLLGHNPAALYEFARLNEASFASDYSIRYQSGPAHRPLFDLFLLAPIVCLSATAAVAKVTERLRDGGRERWLVGFLILTLTAFMGLPKNLRFIVILDPVVRLLSAWFVLHHDWFVRANRQAQVIVAAMVLALNGWIEYSLFDIVFRQRNVYDPTTYELSSALGAIPGTFLPSGPNSSLAIGALLAFGGAGAIVVGGWKVIMTERNEGAEKTSGLRPMTWVVIGIVGLVAAFYAGRSTAPGNAQAPIVPPPNVNIVPTNMPVPGKTVRDPMAEGLDALYGQKDPAKAAARFREVLAGDPNHYGATYQLATALEQAGDRAAARAMWTKMVPMAEASRDDATLAQAKARIAALTDAAEAPAAADPLGETMRLGLEALYEKKDAVDAAKYFRDVLAKNPTHYGATYQLATALEQAGKHEEAKPYWSKTLEMAEANKDSKTAAIARKHLGKTLMFGGFQ